MHAVFYGGLIAHIIDEHRVAQLPNALDAALALLQARGVSGQIQIDQPAEPLQVQALTGGVGAE
jgi:hypothetical protein